MEIEAGTFDKIADLDAREKAGLEDKTADPKTTERSTEAFST